MAQCFGDLDADLHVLTIQLGRPQNSTKDRVLGTDVIVRRDVLVSTAPPVTVASSRHKVQCSVRSQA